MRRRQFLIGMVFFVVTFTVLRVVGRSLAQEPTGTPTGTGTAAPTLTPTITPTPTIVPTETSTPSPTLSGTPPTPAPLLDRLNAETLLPYALRFSIFLRTTPPALTKIALRVYNDVYSRDVPLDLNKDPVELTSGLVLITGIMPLDLADPTTPPVFTTVNYTWTITTRDGRSLVETRSLTIQDERQPEGGGGVWRRIGVPPLEIFSHNPTLSLEFIQIAANRTLYRLSTDLGIPSSLKIALYDAEAQLCQRDAATGEAFLASTIIGGVRFACTPNDALQYYRQSGYTVIRRPDNSLPATRDRVAEIIAERVLADYVSGVPLPHSISAGVVALYGARTRPRDLESVRAALAEGRWLSPEVMNAPPPENAVQLAQYNAQAYIGIVYLADRYGARTPLNLVRWLAAGGSYDDFLRLILNTEPAALDEAAQAWVNTAAAERAVNWSPFLQTTPTATSTLTLYPSTTPTSSVPSATPTRILSRTPAQVLPTRTLTPTVTPLPPGSLRRTVTAEPADIPPLPPSSQSEAAPFNALSWFVPVAIVVITIVGLFLALRRRRL